MQKNTKVWNPITERLTFPSHVHSFNVIFGTPSGDHLLKNRKIKALSDMYRDTELPVVVWNNATVSSKQEPFHDCGHSATLCNSVANKWLNKQANHKRFLSPSTRPKLIFFRTVVKNKQSHSRLCRYTEWCQHSAYGFITLTMISGTTARPQMFRRLNSGISVLEVK